MQRIDYDKLLASVPIDEVAKRLGMELRLESSTRAKALCPFHDDKTPSLLIDSSRDQGRQHFHCFACGAHGDAIDLVKDRLNVGFKEAVDWLGSGFAIHSKIRPSTARPPSFVSGLDSGSGLDLAYRMYQRGSNAARLDDWIVERHLDPTIIRRAGFTHATSNFLSSQIDADRDKSRKRERAGLLEDAYLVRRLFPGVAPALHLKLSAGDDLTTKYGDFFIGERVVFPLYDVKKHLVGLGARSVGNVVGSTSPKYQFTRGFAKASVLYRAEQAFDRMRQGSKQGKRDQTLFICEGFLDALRLEGIGIDVVAVMGNSLSDQQTQLIKALRDSLPGKDSTVTVVVCFDRDEAGLRGGADACLKLLAAGIECKFCWPTDSKLKDAGVKSELGKDPNDYLARLSSETAMELLLQSTYKPALAILAFAFGTTADDALTDSIWSAAPRSRRLRAFTRATAQLKRVAARDVTSLILFDDQSGRALNRTQALKDWAAHFAEAKVDTHGSLSEEFLNDAQARLNHARLLAYMGSKRGELPCDEPRWERLDIAATIFNALLVDRLASRDSVQLGSYDAVWVPRNFGGSEPRLKMMPVPEDLTIQQYLLNEILTERWDHAAFSDSTFSRCIPAVRYYREERRTVTTGFDLDGKGKWGELNGRTLSFAYQIDMDVIEGRQPASTQGMYRPFHECWLDFMKAVSRQVSEIGYVYAVRLDVKRYYDRLRRYVVRDSLQARLKRAIESVTGDTPGFAELLGIQAAKPEAADIATAVLDRLDEQLFGVTYRRPDTGVAEESDPMRGIPQGPVLSAWIGSIALFPLDQEANRIIDRLNTEKTRVGYARYVDDIVLLADSSTTLNEMRESIDRQARLLELTLLAKADEIPAMSAQEFSVYINQGRALAVSGPAWEPPLIGDGESGWDFWSVAPTTDRQSALQLLHNVELYKAPVSAIIQTVRTAMLAPDLRPSELPKVARLLWYAIAAAHESETDSGRVNAAWSRYMTLWNECVQGTSWRLLPEKYTWESPLLFGLEGLEHLLDTKTRDVRELTAEENLIRRNRIEWLAGIVLSHGFSSPFSGSLAGPEYQRIARFQLLIWKARRAIGHGTDLVTRSDAERSHLVRAWHPFEWMHEAVALLAVATNSDEDPLNPFLEPFTNLVDLSNNDSIAACLFRDLLPDRLVQQPLSSVQAGVTVRAAIDTAAIALQTLASVVPRDKVLSCLGRRHRLLTPGGSAQSASRLLLPPPPGIHVRRLFSCIIDDVTNKSIVVARGLEAIELGESGQGFPEFVGADSRATHYPLVLNWSRHNVTVTGGLLHRLEGTLSPEDFLSIRASTESMGEPLAPGGLRAAARLYRAIVASVRYFSSEHPDLELVPAWPYIAESSNGQTYYVIGEGVTRTELGNRAFIRDGGRALRTIEVPIYEADLWRVGATVSDLLGLHDDVSKYSGADTDVTLDAAALGNPARYVLRTQMRKLRGAFADSRISNRQTSAITLPASIERSLRLLEEFPDESATRLHQIAHLLAIETETAAMFLSFREQWNHIEVIPFLKELTSKLIMRLPLSISRDLAVEARNAFNVRRDLWGVLCLSRQLHAQSPALAISQDPAWRALCAGTVCTGISVALDGMIASMRSQGTFETNDAFDFPAEWNVVAAASYESLSDLKKYGSIEIASRQSRRIGLVEQFRTLVRHLGHRLRRESTSSTRISDSLYSNLETVVRKVAQVEFSYEQAESKLDWPFDCLSNQTLDLLNLDLLELTSVLISQLDAEVGFEVVLVRESSYGYNAQSRRFVDSRNGSWEVTPWMISQYPRGAKHIEEMVLDGRVLRVWSEVYERGSGRLLSVSALGEPFASIAIQEVLNEQIPTIDTAGHKRLHDESPEFGISTQAVVLDGNAGASHTERQDGATSEAIISAVIDGDTISESLIAPIPVGLEDESGANVGVTPQMQKPKFVESEHVSPAFDRREFRSRQRENWQTRSISIRREAHVRVALFQMSLGLTYSHPMMEACPSQWPFSADVRSSLATQLGSKTLYEMLARATASSGSEHHWIGGEQEPVQMMNWAEHRRRRVLERVIDSCEAFKVDLLVLPEYSVREETVEWLKVHLANKKVAVLAGTFMEFRQDPPAKHLAAQLTLLWPVPQNISRQLVTADGQRVEDPQVDHDQLERGLVLAFARNKKYRSIALNELIRPMTGPLKPLFIPENLIGYFNQTGHMLSANAVNVLLSQTRLPLKHILELICSEVFLVSSPANYRHMADDYVEVLRRFGETGANNEVENDLKELAIHLSNTGDGIRARRSILAIPAATSRSADYWIAGQACQLAAGITSVFCNGVGKNLAGGSCFVGRGSWKTQHSEPGYLSSITPYHGWSKGIYYNDRNDALSDKDQAVVIADIDPYNMLEGKPRPQTMPVPLKLVAYLPVIECADWQKTVSTLLASNGLLPIKDHNEKGPNGFACDEVEFWGKVQQAVTKPSPDRFAELWKMFPDARVISSRADAYRQDGSIQPSAGSNSGKATDTPAFYDWIDVSLTLSNNQTVPCIGVPSWVKVNSPT